MYTLYYLPGACSLATQIILRELGQEFRLINRNDVENFFTINPVGTVPVLGHNDETLSEGASILLHLLEKHENSMLPQMDPKRTTAIQDLLFANATMHPAYGRLFFIAEAVHDDSVKSKCFELAAKKLNHLWSTVEVRLTLQPFLGGHQPSVADFLLAVYARWGKHFPVAIHLGEKVVQMLAAVESRQSFQLSVAAEAKNQLINSPEGNNK